MPLSPQRIQQIIQFFEKTNVAFDKDLRKILLTEVNYKFRSRLDKFDADAFQLRGDLASLNRVDYLTDGSMPFATWLRNASEVLADLDTEKVFSRSLDELTTQLSGAPAISNPADVPQVTHVQEAIVHRDDMVSFGFLLAGKIAGDSVARLQVPRYDNGMPFIQNNEPEIHQGTGWLLTPDLLITNHHVINARKDGEADAAASDLDVQATHTTVDFDFDAQTMKGTTSVVSKLEAVDPVLDYAILRLSASLQRKPLAFTKDKVQIANDAYIAVNIIQHPYGGPKKVAIRNNLIYDGNFPHLRYFTDTDHGSSGSPVFNDNWQVVALHRASAFVDNMRFQGRATGWVNEGIQIAAVLDDVKTRNSAVYDSIMD